MAAKPPSSSSKEQSYTEEMQRWMARQSFWYRITHGRRNPNSRSFLVTLLILAAWLIPISFFSMVGYYVMLSKFLRTPNFTRLVGNRAALILNVNSPKIFNAHWKSGSLTIDDLQGEGHPSGWVRKLKIGSTRFSLPINKLISKSWSPGNVILQDVDIELRGGLFDAKEAERLAKEQALRDAASTAPLAKFPGLNPDANNFSVQRVLARNTTIRWGSADRSEGEIRDTTLEAVNDGNHWTVRCSGGILNQGWLRNLIIKDLEFVTGKDTITVKKFDFILKAAEGKQSKEGTGQGSGTIHIDKTPTVNIDLSIADVEINRLLNQKHQGILAGQVHGTLVFRGSTSAESAISSSGVLELEPGFTFGTRSSEVFPILDVLGGEMVSIPLRYMEAAKGSVRFSTSENFFECASAVLENFNGERLEGQFTQEISSNNVTGSFKVGFKPDTLKEAPDVAAKFFTETDSRLHWLTIPLNGPMVNATAKQAEAIRTFHRQSTGAGQ